MWAELVDWSRRSMLRPGFELANTEDMDIPSFFKGVDEAIAILRGRHAQWRQAGEPGA